MSETVFYSDTRGHNLFGYRVRDVEATRPFRKGDVAVVNPNLPARHGDYVVARGGDGCALMLFIEGPSGALLATLGSEEPPVSASRFVLLGRVVEKRRSYK